MNLRSSELIFIHITVEFNLVFRGMLNSHMVFSVNIQRLKKNVLSIYIWIKMRVLNIILLTFC